MLTMSRSSTIPFFPISSRIPNQSPESRGLSQSVPPQVGGMSTGWAPAGPARRRRAAPSTSAPVLRGRHHVANENLIVTSAPSVVGEVLHLDAHLLGGHDCLAKGHVGQSALERLEGGGEVDLVALKDGRHLDATLPAWSPLEH